MDSDDFFEGAEKRISLLFDQNMLNIDKSVWCKWINKIGCNILSTIENDKYIFFLLSESSCLIGKNYVMIKTCGKTQPLIFLDLCKNEGIDVCSFEYSHSDFLKQDIQPYPYNHISNELDILSKYNIQYKTNKNRLYCSNNNLNKNFYELISYKFNWIEEYETLLKNIILLYFPNSIIDDKHFDPCGYSLNMLHDMSYITIHVTPQQSCSYLSIESNDTKSLSLFDSITSFFQINEYMIHTPEDCKFNNLNNLILS